MDFAQPDHNVASAEKAVKQKRAKAYSDAKMEIIKTEVGAGTGYRSIVKNIRRLRSRSQVSGTPSGG